MGVVIVHVLCAFATKIVVNPNLGKRGSIRPLAHSYACISYVWPSIKLKLLDISDQHVLHMCIKFYVHKLNTHWDIAML